MYKVTYSLNVKITTYLTKAKSITVCIPNITESKKQLD